MRPGARTGGPRLGQRLLPGGLATTYERRASRDSLVSAPQKAHMASHVAPRTSPAGSPASNTIGMRQPGHVAAQHERSIAADSEQRSASRHPLAVQRTARATRHRGHPAPVTERRRIARSQARAITAPAAAQARGGAAAGSEIVPARTGCSVLLISAALLAIVVMCCCWERSNMKLTWPTA